jgi:hypothetical protein
MTAPPKRVPAYYPANARFLAISLTLLSLITIVIGALVAREAVIVAALAVGGPIVAWLAIAHPGVTLGGIWLIALNGIPFIDLEGKLGAFKNTDVAMVAIASLAAIQWLTASGQTKRTPFPRGVGIACITLAIWWSITVARSVNGGIPLPDAVLYGRDFLFLTIVIPAGWQILGRPRAWRECMLLVFGGTLVFALAYVASAAGLANPTLVIHPHRLLEVGSLARLYTPMNDLIVAAAVIGIAILATTPKSRFTRLVGASTAVMLLAFAFQLTRAAYIGVAIGLVVAVGIALSRGRSIRRIVTRRASIVLAIVGIALFILMQSGLASDRTTVVGERIASGLTEADSNSGTVGYRVKLYDKMIAVLGTSWPVGLGFLHPKDRYFSEFPQGSIRNPDVGLMNAVMTMGVVGLIFLYGILGAVGLYVAHTRKQRPVWIVVGLFSVLAVLIASSPTLVTLFSPTGLLTTGLTLTVCAVATKEFTGRGVP